MTISQAIESRLTVGSITATGTNDGSSLWEVSSIGTWFDPVTADDDMIERIVSGVDALSSLPRKAFTLRGRYKGTTPADMRAAQAEFAALRGSGLVPVTYSEDGQESSRNVVVVQAESPGTYWSSRMEWALDVIAPDPRRYGPWTTSAANTSNKTVVNQGTAPSPLTVTITRNADAQAVSAGGIFSNFSRPLADGSTLLFDGEKLDVYLSGQRTLGVTALRWPTAAPRASTLVSVSGASSWSVGYRDAWW